MLLPLRFLKDSQAAFGLLAVVSFNGLRLNSDSSLLSVVLLIRNVLPVCTGSESALSQ